VRAATVLPVALLVVGLLLMVLMISTESEPGALPLLLVLVGAGWLVASRVRRRTRPAPER
jgi:MYXO-CTERM domain-containing protein